MAIVSRSFDKSTIIFENQAKAHRLKIIMGLSDVKAGELHGDMTQTQRLALDDFRTGKVTHLIATDVAARVWTFHPSAVISSTLRKPWRATCIASDAPLVPEKGTALTFMEEADRKL